MLTLKVVLLLAALAIPALAFAKESSVTLRVEGWSCEGCTAATAAQLKKLPGVASVATDLAKKTAVIDYDDAKVTLADLEKAVSAAGYKVVK